MLAIFQLQHNAGCKVTVVGVERQYGTYGDGLTFDNTVTLNVLYRVSLDEEYEKIDEAVSEHYPDDYTSFKIDADGLYKISHIIFPKKEAVDVTSSKILWCYDEGLFFRYEDGEWLQKDIDKDLLANPEQINSNFNIAISCDYLFSICNLKTCFFKLLKDLLGKMCGADKCNTKKYEDQTYKRDILWMGINAIDYLLDEERYFDALRLLLTLTGCSGFCNDDNYNGGNDCGCRA